MSDLDKYFQSDASQESNHPLIRFIQTASTKNDFKNARITILRTHSVVGVSPAQITVELFDKTDSPFDFKSDRKQ